MIVVFLFSFSFACSPPSELNRNKYREENSFPQDFKSTGAYLVLEWNSKKPFIMASGSLVNREKGIFLTAKHFSDAFGLLGVDYCKVFFNGKVYKAVLVKVPPIRDAALIKLASSFSVKDFPALVRLVYFFGPTTIEVLRPAKLEIPVEELQDGIMDMVEMVQSYNYHILKLMNKKELDEFQRKLLK